MSVSSKLFYSSDSQKQTLHRRIIPTEDQQKSQQERWNDLIDYLTEDLKEKTEYTIQSWLQGSYKFGTQIRPSSPNEEFDIDLGIYFRTTGLPSQFNFQPLEIKEVVQESLKIYAQEAGNDVIDVINPPKNRCNRIRFTESFHIDTPVYHLDFDKDVRSLATQENKWESSDPKALFSWFRDNCKEEAEGQQIRRLIRYIKMWAALSFKEEERPSTIVLTVLMVEAFKNVVTTNSIEDDDLFALCVDHIESRIKLNNTILNPVDRNENLNRMDDTSYNSFVDKFSLLKSICSRALNVATEADSAVIWQEAFRHFFPLPEVLEENAGNKNTALTVIEFIPQVLVTAQPKSNPNVSGYTGVNKIGPIPKGCEIKFRITNLNQLPQGSKIEWVVRNEGYEAENTNDLGHSCKDGFETIEHSAYNGDHYMDLVVKSYLGNPIGFLRIPVKVSGIAFPPRNPKRKPGYTKINRTRR